MNGLDHTEQTVQESEAERTVPVRSTSQAKRWAFTINYAGVDGETQRNEEFAMLSREMRVLVEGGHVSYFIIGRESGDINGTPHIQGYVELVKRKRMKWLKDNIDHRGHYEVARAKCERNIEYCKKGGEYEEHGTPSSLTSEQGKRTDLEKLHEDLKDGMTMAEVADEHFGAYLKYGPAIKRWKGDTAKVRTTPTEVYIHWGDTGTGKTYSVYEKEDALQDLGKLWKAFDNNMQWFDGYEGQEAVLFDDIHSIPDKGIGFLLQLLDWTPMSVPVKGGSVNWAPKRVYFTSNKQWQDWTGMVSLSEEHLAAFERRITKVTHFTALRTRQ